jgi:hypothetical protein
MDPRERVLIEVDGLVITLETDAFVRQCPEICYARHGFDRTRELPVLTCRIEASRHGLRHRAVARPLSRPGITSTTR